MRPKPQLSEPTTTSQEPKDDRVVDSNGRTGTFYRYDKYRDGTFAMVKFDDAMTLRRVNPAELTQI